jgi:hypothetical protein
MQIPIASAEITQAATSMPMLQPIQPNSSLSTSTPDLLRTKSSSSHPVMWTLQRKPKAQLPVKYNDSVGKKNDTGLKQDLIHRFKIASYFALWYALNIMYNSKFNLFFIVSFVNSNQIHFS